MGGKKVKKPPKTPEEREARKAELKAGRIAKKIKKETQALKKIQKAAKKAKDFEVRKLKRRLRLIAQAENKPVDYSGVKDKDDSSTATDIKSEPSAEPHIKTEPKSDDESSNSSSSESSSESEDEAENEESMPSGKKTKRVYEEPSEGGNAGSGSPEEPPKLPKFEKGSKEKIFKQLQSGMQLCHLGVGQMAGQELGLGITKNVEIKLRADNPPAAAKAAEPISDKMLTAFAEKVLKHKAVQEEMTEARALVDKLKAEDEKAERRAAKSARKAARKAEKEAAAEAARAERIAQGLPPEEEAPSGDIDPEDLPPPPPTTKKQRRLVKVKERREQKKAQKQRRKVIMGEKARERALTQVKDKSKYAVKNPEKHAIKKAARLEKRKRVAEARVAGGEGGPPSAKKARKGPGPLAAKQSKPATDGPLHPSWAAKKQQTVSISQDKPSGKKVVFD